MSASGFPGTKTDSTHASELGQTLRAAREAMGLSVEDVSQAIKIQVTAVRNIESGQFSKLGPIVFARGFVRSYAKHVKLGVDWVETELATLALDVTPELVPSQTGRSERSNVGERGMLAMSYLVGTAILVSGIVVVTNFDRFVGPRTATATTEAVTTAPTQSEAPAPTIAVATQTDVLTLPAGAPNPALLGAPSVLSTPAPPALVALTPALVQTPTEQPSVTVDSPTSANGAVAASIAILPNLGSGDVNALELSVSGLAWVEITDSTGRRLEFNNLSSGARKSYSGKAPFSLKIGNAGRANLSAGGKVIDLASFTNASVAKLRLIEVNGELQATAQ
jgi:cytoskeleton protein RodZ